MDVATEPTISTILDDAELKLIRRGFDPIAMIAGAQLAFAQAPGMVQRAIQQIIDDFYLSDVAMVFAEDLKAKARLTAVYGEAGKRPENPGAAALFDEAQKAFKRFLAEPHAPHPRQWAQMRESLTIGALAAQRGDLFLAVHVLWGLQVGLTPDDLVKLVQLQSVYAGGIASFNAALTTLRRTFSTLKKVVGRGFDSSVGVNALREEFETTDGEVAKLARLLSQTFVVKEAAPPAARRAPGRSGKVNGEGKASLVKSPGDGEEVPPVFTEIAKIVLQPATRRPPPDA
jgi:hypothetical protein